MGKAGRSDRTAIDDESRTRRVRLPGFITDEEIGLGDVIKRATSYVGMKSCAGCELRAATLNRWIVFTTRSK
jgi:hypothetical protein